MATALTEKQVSEAYFITFDFASKLGAETIASAVVVATDLADSSVVTGTLTNAVVQTNTATVVSSWVRAGSSGHSYNINCTILGSAGSIYELDAILPVIADPTVIPTSGRGIVTAPFLEPVSLSEVKDFIYVDTTDYDTKITSMIIAARREVEAITGRALLTQTWDCVMDDWPETNYIKLPFGNLQFVTSIKWLDTAGTSTTLTVTTDYLVETNGDFCGRIVLPYATSWPSGSLYPSNPIIIRFVCGWTATALIPYEIKVAIKMIVADLYQNRERQIVDAQSYNENPTVQRLLADQRLWDRCICR